MIYDVIVIGGGAAGMMAANTAAKNGKKVVLLEKNEKLGKKLYITGKGRCNVTNAIDMDEFQNYIPKNSKFLYSAFHSLSNLDLIHMLHGFGVETKVERGNRVFPISDKASDIIEAFRRSMNNNGVEICLNTCVSGFECCDETYLVKTNKNDFEANKVIVCTGGVSYPLTGSTGDGYQWAESHGHSVMDLYPSLVPLVVEEGYIADLQGLSLKNIEVTLYQEKKKLYQDFGELLFTHYGLSGPTILSSSFYASNFLRKNKKVKISIDLKPGLTIEELDKRLLKDFDKNLNKQFKNSLDELLPQKLIPVIVKVSEIDPNKEVNQITKQERRALCTLLKAFTFHISKTRPIAEAIITSGGVKVSEIIPQTMESKLCPGLYFAGEVLDVDAFTGGFNLQIAFSTGYTAGISV